MVIVFVRLIELFIMVTLVRVMILVVVLVMCLLSGRSVILIGVVLWWCIFESRVWTVVWFVNVVTLNLGVFDGLV